MLYWRACQAVVCHPVQAKLVRIAKKLKKNNVAVDIVSFGSADENEEKLEAFLAAVNSGDNSHLVTVPAGTVLADSLFGSPIFQASRTIACPISKPDSALYSQEAAHADVIACSGLAEPWPFQRVRDLL